MLHFVYRFDHRTNRQRNQETQTQLSQSRYTKRSYDLSKEVFLCLFFCSFFSVIKLACTVNATRGDHR